MRADSPPPFRAQPAVLRAFCGALLLAVGGNALSLPGKRFVGRYDFGYAIGGDRAARPAMVFDDGGGKIYFEARPGQPMPAVFAGKDLALLVMQPEGQYFTARTTAGEFTLVLGAARAIVRRGAAALGDEVVVPAADGGEPATPADDEHRAGSTDGSATVLHEQPVVFASGSAALRPEVLDALAALVVRIGHEAPVTIIGRDDAGQAQPLAGARAQALRNALLARGVAASRIELADDDGASVGAQRQGSVLRWRTSQPPGVAASPSFEILPADRDIAVTLRRWARDSGYDVDWDVDWRAPINGALRVQAPSFPAAVQQVVAGLRAQGYPVRTQSSSERLVRFTSTD